MEEQFLDPALLRPLLSLLLSALIVMGSPGPSTISVTATGSAFGLRRSVPFVAGLIAGTTAVLLAVAAGLMSILLSRPQLSSLLVGLSAVYIVYLAYNIAVAPPLSHDDAKGDAPTFPGGFLLAVANPKAYVAIAAVFAGTRLGLGSELSEALAKSLVLAAMIVAIHLAWLLAGAMFSRFLYQPAISRVVNLSFAAILVVSTFMAIKPIAT
jgi:threonine/homoserine/homoserine lactone efflux protein